MEDNARSFEELKGQFESQETVSVLYILKQIEAIRADNKHIHEAITSVAAMEAHAPFEGHGDYANQAKAEAISQIIKSREETNQKMIELYEKVYDDIKPYRKENTADIQISKINEMRHILQSFVDNDNLPDSLADALGDIFKSAFA